MPGLLAQAIWCHLPASAALQASGEALLAAAELLKWKQLRHLLQTQQTWRIGECLVRTTPKPQGPGWTRAAPRARGEGCPAVPPLPCSSPEPGARSCILLPCPHARSPQGLFSRPLSPPRTQREGEVSAPLAPLCLWLSLNLSPTGLLAGRWEWPGRGRGTRGAARRAWSGHLRRGCDMPIPLCSLQVVQDRSRAEEYCHQSLPYLQDAQATVREAAVRFIGEPQPPGSLFWQPGPSPCHCTVSKEQPRAGPWPPSPSPAHAGGLGGRLAQCHPPRVLVFPGLSPDEGEEGVQPSRQGRALCCWERAGEWEV